MENWKPVIGFEGRYEVSDFGNVKSLITRDSRGQRRTPGILKASPYKKNGSILRMFLTLTDGKGNKYTTSVHTIVMASFVGVQHEGYHVCHNNGDATDNRLENLRYGTPKENEHDKLIHGRSQRGERNVKAKLKLDQVLEIKKLDLTQYGSLKRAAEKYNISNVTISHIQKGRQWAWVK